LLDISLVSFDWAWDEVDGIFLTEDPMKPTNLDASPSGEASDPDNGPIRLAGSFLDRHRHVCAFFHSAEEEYRVLLPFIKDGFDRRERAFHIVDPKLREEHLRRLKTAGIDVASVEESGQFELVDWDETYLQDGHFNTDRLLALVQDVLENGMRQGFPLTRLVGHMEWALEDWPGVDDLLTYEARLNNMSPIYKKNPLICVYDLSKFGGDIVVDILRTHPMVIIGGILQENPFFVPPDQFLIDLRERRALRNN
jgi:DcmR-like sensory protein